MIIIIISIIIKRLTLWMINPCYNGYIVSKVNQKPERILKYWFGALTSYIVTANVLFNNYQKPLRIYENVVSRLSIELWHING